MLKDNITHKDYYDEIEIVSDDEYEYLKMPLLGQAKVYDINYRLTDIHLAPPFHDTWHGSFNVIEHMESKGLQSLLNSRMAMEAYFDDLLDTECHIKLSDSFKDDRLYQTMMKQVLFEYYRRHHYDEEHFYHHTSIKIMVELIGKHIGLRRLEKVKNLQYETAKAIYYKHA